MQIRPLFISILMLCCLQSSSPVAFGDPVSLPPDKPSALSVLIAVPENQGQRAIVFKAADPYFDVVIHNDSSEPQKVWDENCSMGYGDVTLEVTEMDGKPLPEPLVVSRSAGVWRSNSIRALTLSPGESTVREIHIEKSVKHPASLLSLLSPPSFRYDNFPYEFASSSSSPSIQYRRLRMRAVFESELMGPFGKPGDVWTGRIMSKARDYTVSETFYH